MDRHLPSAHRSDGDPAPPVPARLAVPDRTCTYHLTSGWPMWVPPDPQAHAVDHPDLPPEVLTIARYASGLGCDCVLFDADADQVGDLPTRDW